MNVFAVGTFDTGCEFPDAAPPLSKCVAAAEAPDYNSARAGVIQR
jgi:hypothetical protein